MQHRGLVLGARTALIMLAIAAVVILGLGLASLLLADPPEVDGWLRSVFGRVFGVVAVTISVILGLPAAIGLWAMAGATREEAVPALSRNARIALTAIAVGTVALTVLLTLGGRSPAILDLGLIGLVALASLGLAGAAAFAPRRGRALLAALALVIVEAGTAWVLIRILDAGSA